MSKRKLTRRQNRRIAKNQHARQARADKRPTDTEATWNENDFGSEESGLGPEESGLVITHFGTQVLVEAGERRRRCYFRANLGSLVAGDRVVWRDGEPYGVIVALHPRDSALLRPDPYGDMKPVAANIDRLVIVVAPYPEPKYNFIDRYLVAAENSDITPVILINKVDRLDEAQQPLIDSMEALYQSLGYSVMRVSAQTREGLDALAQYLSHYTSAFVGQSGVGKSSLTNALLPGSDLRVAPLSDRGIGSHTTTNAQLFHFPTGGQLIDSPGIREFGLWHMSAEAVLEGFIDIRRFSGQCRFRDCAHDQEPGCALQAAQQAGEIHPQRMASYRQILSDLTSARTRKGKT